MGKTGYGIWVLIGSFLGYYGLLNLGVRSALTRYVARYAGQGDEKALNETAGTAMAMFSCTGVLAIAASFLLAEPLAVFFEVAPEHLDDFKYVVWILGLATGLSFPGNVFAAIVVAYERYVAANVANVTTTLMRAGLIVWMLLQGKGLVGVAYAALGASLLNIMANFLICRHFAPRVRVSFAAAKWPVLRILLVYGASTTVIAIANILRFNLDSVVIGKWVGIPQVGIYGIAGILIRYISHLITAGMSVLTPRFAALDGAEEKAKLQGLFVRSLSVSALLGFGTAMMAIIFGGRFIVLWVGEEFIDAIPVLWILAIGYALALSQYPGIGLMFALNKHHFLAIATIIEGVANVAISILLALKYGIVGVALGTLIPMLVVKILIQPFYVSKIIRISIIEYIKPFIVPATIGSILVILGYHLGGIIHRMCFSLYELVGLAIIVGLIYTGTVIFVSKHVGLADIMRNLIKTKDRAKTKWE